MATGVRSSLNVRGRRFEGSPLHLQIGLDVDLEGLQVCVPKEVLDGDRGHARLEHVHRLGVPERVGTDAGSLNRGYLEGCKAAIVVEKEAHTRAGEPLPAVVQQEGRTLL